MKVDLVVRGCLVLPTGLAPSSWVAIGNGRISAIGDGDAPDAEQVFDAGEDLIFPGIVDGQTHACSYGGYPGIESTTRSAIAGGVTTIVDMPYDNPDPLNTVDRLEAKISSITKLAHANVALYATIMPGQPLDQVQGLISRGVAAFKISTFESSPTRFPRISTSQILGLFGALASTDIPLGVHNEDQEIVLAGIEAAKAAGKDGIQAHSESRPLAAELSATAQFLELGAAADAHAHIVHLTTARGFQLVDSYLNAGYRATGELCVHYLWFDPERDGDELGAKIKVNPPIRPGEIDHLWDEIIAGRVAFVSSDHSSWPIDNKFTSSIFTAGAGIPGLETLLPAFFTAAESRVADPALMTLDQLCERPAKFFGLWPRKGTIQLGSDADLTIISRKSQSWNSANAHDELNWSPFDNREFSVTVRRTYLGGKLAFDGKDVVNRPGSGEYVPRGESSWFE